MRGVYVLFVWIILAISPVYATCIVTDDAGRVVRLNHPAARIMTLAPDATEIVFQLGGGKQMVGTVSASDYPLAARSITRVGSYAGLDVEAMLRLKPDLIIAFGGQFSGILARFQQQGVAVYYSQPKTLAAVADGMQRIGCLIGKEQTGKREKQRFLVGLEKLKASVPPGRPKRVFFQLGAYGLMTINKQSWINQAITLCGGQNIYQEAKLAAPVVSMESVLALNPEVILTETEEESWRQNWLKYKEIQAVSDNKLTSIPADWIDRAGPRLLLGIQAICAAIYPRQGT